MKVSKDELFAKIPTADEAAVDAALAAERTGFDRKIIVLDDDPTGVQTVNGIHVYTDWSEESIAEGFAEKNAMFFILTNSRAFQAKQTGEEHWKIAERVAAEAKRTGQPFMLISRGDSRRRRSRTRLRRAGSASTARCSCRSSRRAGALRLTMCTMCRRARS